ncbi:MAG TPA: four helix bundle protein [Bacteroidia bacterium]|nr:four helix bundle protein [Bacteroidia bacterium]
MDKIELQNRTFKFSVRIYKMVEKFPKSFGADMVARQILRSSSSVAANYRAACRAKSDADFINKLKTVEEEADETLFWLEFIQEAGIIIRNLLVNVIKESKELVAIFTASVKTSKFKIKK